MYCSSDAHRAINCDNIIKPEDRKKIVAEKHLCCNCAGAKHRAAECKSKGKCRICQARHHTSICDKSPRPGEPGMTANHVLRVGRSGDPVAEHTKFGWSIMSPGAERDVTLGCLAVNSTSDYDNLCALDVLGLADNVGADADVFNEFKEQLTRSKEGWYETALPWRPTNKPLLSNIDGSLHSKIKAKGHASRVRRRD